MNNEALILIDIQDVYFTPGDYLLHEPEKAALKAKAVLDKFRKEGKCVIHVKHAFKNHAEIYSLVKPLESEKVVYKTKPSSFLKTDLKAYLDENGITKITIVGMMSHMCVDTTVRACQDHGYNVTVISDACTTKDLVFEGQKVSAVTVHAAFMAALDGMFAKVVSLNDYLQNT